FFDASARSSIWILQGVTSLPVLAIPTIGFLKSSSSNPTALNIARFGAFAGPSLKTLLLILKSFFTTYPPLSCFIILQFFYFSIYLILPSMNIFSLVLLDLLLGTAIQDNADYVMMRYGRFFDGHG